MKDESQHNKRDHLFPLLRLFMLRNFKTDRRPFLLALLKPHVQRSSLIAYHPLNGQERSAITSVNMVCLRGVLLFLLLCASDILGEGPVFHVPPGIDPEGDQVLLLEQGFEDAIVLARVAAITFDPCDVVRTSIRLSRMAYQTAQNKKMILIWTHGIVLQSIFQR